MTTQTIQLLGHGQLANSKTTIYTVPASTSTIVKTITLVNTNTTTENVNLYIYRATASRRIIPQNMNLVAGNLVIYDDELCLEAGDLIEGDTTTASKVDYSIHGCEDA